MTITIDLPQDEEKLVRAAAGQEDVDPATYLINMLRHHLLCQEIESSVQLRGNNDASVIQRMGNLHPGNFRFSENFDDPLPDEFWLGQS
ncbi:MAG: hypothetical protein AAF702_46135 [Chloroflexota bacterium]